MTVRFFTSLLLRANEEVDASLVCWLSAVATVDADAGRPLTGVWQSAIGDRRIAWYAEGITRELRASHAERYGDEPYWVIDLDADRRGATVLECDADGNVAVMRHWMFDDNGMPKSCEERSASGRPLAVRAYRTLEDATVVQVRERRPPSSPEISLPRPRANPIAELSAEPFPCGGTFARGAVRIVGTIAENEFQGRYRSVARVEGAWRPAITTLATTTMGRLGTLAARRALRDSLLSVSVVDGQLEHPRRGVGHDAHVGVTELVPSGATVEEVVAQGPLAPSDAVTIAGEIGELSLRAHARGHELGCIRPELVYVERLSSGWRVNELLVHGPLLLSVTYSGEERCWPPTCPSDFGSRDDLEGLAQLVWFMLTGDHPFLGPEDVRWDPTWNEFRHKRRKPQPWRGPRAFAPLLEQVLFGDRTVRPDMAGFLDAVRTLSVS